MIYLLANWLGISKFKVAKLVAIPLSVHSTLVLMSHLLHKDPSIAESHPEQKQQEYHPWTALDCPAEARESTPGCPLPSAQNPSVLVPRKLFGVFGVPAVRGEQDVQLDYSPAKPPDAPLPQRVLEFWTVRQLG